MSIPEIISPNVRKILHLEIPSSTSFGAEATIHPNGVIEIDTTLDFEDIVIDNFNKYEHAGAVYPVSVTGLEDIESGISSHRFCAWDADFADLLTSVVNRFQILQLIHFRHGILQFAGVSKYFRFMRYDSGGEHFPHYDSDFTVWDRSELRYVTRYSLVMYFNDCETGEIAFIDNDPHAERGDWNRQATDEEISLRIKPRAGKIVLFPHDLCHTVLPFTDPDHHRLIVRGDLIFTRESMK